MDTDTTATKTPIHLWIVGVIALLWNAFGCYDYFMTRTQGAAYVKSMMPTRYPARATSTARFAVVLDFPVPPRNECVEMIFDKVCCSLLSANHVLESMSFTISARRHPSLRCRRKS